MYPMSIAAQCTIAKIQKKLDKEVVAHTHHGL